jgi:hypothetical protein
MCAVHQKYGAGTACIPSLPSKGGDARSVSRNSNRRPPNTATVASRIRRLQFEPSVQLCSDNYRHADRLAPHALGLTRSQRRARRYAEGGKAFGIRGSSCSGGGRCRQRKAPRSTAIFRPLRSATNAVRSLLSCLFNPPSITDVVLTPCSVLEHGRPASAPTLTTTADAFMYRPGPLNRLPWSTLSKILTA